jgi:integrase/recombinase XerD
MTATLPQHKQANVKRIPISPDLAAVVQRIIERVGMGKPFVQMSDGRLTMNFCTARTKAGLPPSITFHSLRHSFASWLAALGTDFRTLQALTGHSSSEALGIYLHAFDPAKRSAIEKLHIPRAASANG